MNSESTEGRAWEDEVPPSIAVVEAVAAHDGVDASTLDPPLNSVVDGDALDTLFAGRNEDPNATVSFSFRGHLVEVTDGGVTVGAVDSAGDSGGERGRTGADEAVSEVADGATGEGADSAAGEEAGADDSATGQAAAQTREESSTTRGVTNR